MTIRIGMTGGCSFKDNIHVVFVDCLVDQSRIQQIPLSVLENNLLTGDVVFYEGRNYRVLAQEGGPSLLDQLARFKGLHQGCCPKREPVTVTDPTLTFVAQQNGQIHAIDSRLFRDTLVARQEREGGELVMSLRGRGVIDISDKRPELTKMILDIQTPPTALNKKMILPSVLTLALLIIGSFWYNASHE